MIIKNIEYQYMPDNKIQYTVTFLKNEIPCPPNEMDELIKAELGANVRIVHIPDRNEEPLKRIVLNAISELELYELEL